MIDEIIDFFTEGYGALALAGLVMTAPIALILWLNWQFINGR